MFFRVIFAAIIGGALAFGGGFLDHMVLELVGRQMKYPTNEASLRDTIKATLPDPGVYGVPHLPKNFKQLSEDEQKKAWTATGEEYKKGPSAWIVVAPTGEEMMDMKTLGFEAASNVIAAFLAALVVAMSRPGLGFVVRWFIVMLIGVFSWVSVNASYHIWYRFPQPWVLDELYCALIEWALAGIAIAAIVVPKQREYGY